MVVAGTILIGLASYALLTSREELALQGGIEGQARTVGARPDAPSAPEPAVDAPSASEPVVDAPPTPEPVADTPPTPEATPPTPPAPDGIVVKNARLLDAIGTAGMQASLYKPASDSVFLWVEVRMERGPAPKQIDVHEVRARWAEGRAVTALGYSTYSLEDGTPSVEAMLEMPNTQGQATMVPISGYSEDEHIAARYDLLGKRATLTLKALPATFSLLFKVPRGERSFRVEGLVDQPIFVRPSD